MSKNLIGIQGILVTVSFLLGFFILFMINPQTFREVNNISIAAFNLRGMSGRLWAMINYLIIGSLNFAFCGTLLTLTSRNLTRTMGAVLLMAAGVIWFTFGIIPYNPTSDLGNHMLLIGIILMISAGSIGFILLAVELDKISNNKFLKWYTLSSGFLILLLSSLSVFVFNDLSWIRTNLSITIYFVWFGVFGSIYLRDLPNSYKMD